MKRDLIERRLTLLESFLKAAEKYSENDLEKYVSDPATERKMRTRQAEARSALNRMIVPVKQAMEAVGIAGVVTIRPPPMVQQRPYNTGVIDNLFAKPYGESFLDLAVAYVERAIGAYQAILADMDDVGQDPLLPSQEASEPEAIPKKRPIAFISHDSRDKDAIARPLFNELQKAFPGERIWFDESELVVGDSLRESIDAGLRESECCILILSKNYLSNSGWTKMEFDGVFTRELLEQRNVVLPVWVGVEREEVFQYATHLPNRLAARWDGKPAETAGALARAIWKRLNAE